MQQFPPELVEQIRAAIASGALQLGNPGGRTGQSVGRFSDPRQLDDLSLMPTRDDARPTFFWSAEKPRNGYTGAVSEYPKLMWKTDSGAEITVRSAEEQAQRVRAGYVLVAPHQVILDPMEELRLQWESLDPADQAVIMKAQKEDRIAALTAKLSQLDPEQLEALMANAGRKARKVQ